MSGRIEADEFAVNVLPIHKDDAGEEYPGELCSYACNESLPSALEVAGAMAEEWLNTPSRRGREGRGPVYGFEITVSNPGFPEPI